MNKETRAAVAWAGGMLVLTAGTVVAHRLGYIDRDVVMRVEFGVLGLWIACFGNRIPKTFVRDVQARQAQRVSAWAQVLSGLVYAGLWAFAPIPVATWYGTAVILISVAVTLGYCLTLRSKAKAS